jgi:hypothetical protein
MSELNGKNYKKVYVNVPAEKYSEGDFAAPLRSFTDTYDLDGTAIADGDILNLFKLTKQSRILGGFVKFDNGGATGIFKLGIEGDDDALIAAADFGGGAAGEICVDIDGAGKGAILPENAKVILTCTEVTALTAGTVQVTLFVSES